MRELLVETTEGVTLRRELAGPGSRAAAAAIDLLLLSAAWAVLVLAVGVLAAVDPSGLSRFAVGLLVGGVVVLPAVYQIAFALAWRGATPGKRVLRLRALGEDGGPARALQHVLRGLFFPVEALVLALPVPVALLLVATTERRQRLGDLVAGTVVVREAEPGADREPWPDERWSALQRRLLPLVPAHAARLEAEDRRLLGALLGRVGLEPDARARLEARAARQLLERLGLDPALAAGPDGPRAVLREIHLFLREPRAAG